MTDREQRFAEETPQEPVAQEVSQPTQQLPVRNKLKRLHLFAAFCERPTNVSFETQEPDEQILLFLRKSMWVNFPWIFAALVLVFLPAIAFLARDFFATFIPPLNVILVMIPFYYLLVVIYVFVNFITWYYNVAIVTNKRIIDVDFHQIVFKDVAETKLALIQDISYKQNGVLPNLLGYGFVLIQTAGTLENFEFNTLPHPARIEEIVEELIGGKRFYEP